MPGWSGVVDVGAILGLRSPNELVAGATVVGTSSYLYFRAQEKARTKMPDILNDIKNYSKGFIDAALIGTSVILGFAFYQELKKNEALEDRIEEQNLIIQRFGWSNPSARSYCRPSTRYTNYNSGGEEK